MKKDIHPNYISANVNCTNCKTSFDTQSTLQNIKVDICSNCHPFYTGTQVYVDTAGRIERFNKRYSDKSS